jgi:hypothetical protein
MVIYLVWAQLMIVPPADRSLPISARKADSGPADGWITKTVGILAAYSHQGTHCRHKNHLQYYVIDGLKELGSE